MEKFIKIHNQPNRFHVLHKDKNGERLVKVYYKSNNATMLVFKNITANNAVGRINALKSMYQDWQGSFIITQ